MKQLDFLKTVMKNDQRYGSDMIITICGPIRLWSRIETCYSYVRQLPGVNYVFTPVKFYNEASRENDKLKEQLMQLHRDKIDMADYVIVVGKEEEWGNDTFKEIDSSTI